VTFGNAFLRYASGQIDKQSDGQIDRQTDRRTYIRADGNTLHSYRERRNKHASYELELRRL